MMRPEGVFPTVSLLPTARRMQQLASQSPDDPEFWSGKVQAVAARRDVDAFILVFEHFGPRLKRYLMGLNADEAQADELVQETMLRLWRRAELFDAARASVTTWLFRIARNLFLDRVRGQRHALTRQDALDALEADDAEGGEHLLDVARLEHAIQALPPQQARMLRMAYFEAKTHSQIAEELAMPLGSVKSSIRRSFAKLKVAMGGCR
jgi:RNA polymerase sigma factor (sigma-70 family)